MPDQLAGQQRELKGVGSGKLVIRGVEQPKPHRDPAGDLGAGVLHDGP
ncbi:hypothetical protein VA596_24485 [Amycolatopsis sp., V23-08]|uniref:Uncharacterized protein n=1 Tax=Amycolatopsis heterodermiae TaxID=3110235 RepID=A0ABU5R918_9PSEU|nr:hypothetical protein [Amycolatopsis sp., V23-08]MEA5362716.1 hypothetical protein [Amycolatopsis sp., V23-08]